MTSGDTGSRPPAPPAGPGDGDGVAGITTGTGARLDDPRLDDGSIDDEAAGEEIDVDPAPAVAFKDRPWVMWAGLAGAVALGGIVFTTLLTAQSQRNLEGQFATAVDPSTADPNAVEQAEPPALFAPPPPPAFNPFAPVPSTEPPAQPSWQNQPSPPPPPPPTPPQVVYTPPPPPPPPFTPPRVPDQSGQTPMPPEPPQVATAVPPSGASSDQRARSPTLVIDLTTAAAAAAAAAGQPGADGQPAPIVPVAAGVTEATETARARRLANPGATIPQGAMIAAVLETAIDSDLPGLVRAVVSRDVRSFDGSRVLIPRGSRLVGNYTAEVALGQSRALVVWGRMIRPDGVSVQITSPGTDPQGRAGLSGRVDRHLLQRYGPGVLLTAVNAAFRNDSGTQVVLGAATNAVPQAENIKPTVRVAPGTAIQVFVARDLDFSGVTR